MKEYRAWLLASAGLVALSCERGEAAREPAFNGSAAYQYAAAQMMFGPRVPGTDGAQRAGDWIEQQMRQRADTVIVQRWAHTLADGREVQLRNIFAQFRPNLTSRVLYVTHWDTRPRSDAMEDATQRELPVPGANDGASGVGLFLALADALKRVPPGVGVDLLFVDGEDYGDFGTNTDVLLGSTHFAENLPIPGYRPIFGVVWDMIGDKDLQIYQEGYSLQGAPEVVQRVWQTAADLGHDKVFIRQQIGAIVDDHVPLLKIGFRVINVIDIDYPHHHRTSDTLDKISARSLAIVGEVAEALVR